MLGRQKQIQVRNIYVCTPCTGAKYSPKALAGDPPTPESGRRCATISARGSKLAIRLACTSHFMVGVAVGMAMGLVTGDWLVMVGVTVIRHVYLHCGWGWRGAGIECPCEAPPSTQPDEHGAC